jgi:protein SCO1
MRNETHRRSALTSTKLMLFATLLACGLSGCAKQAQTQSQGQAQAQHYPLKGKVVSVDTSNSSLSVDMEAIPGYMGAMTMSYPVHNPGDLVGLHPGDSITADLIVASDGAYLDHIQVAKKDSGTKKASGGS